jgi:hypothetical protein
MEDESMRRSSNVRVLPLAVLLACCAPAGADPSATRWQRPPNAYPYNKVITKLAYPYEMGAKERKAFVNKLKALRPGDSYEAVIKLLGPPYIQHTHAPKKSREVRETSLVYCLKMLDEHPGNADDRVDVVFDVQNRLFAIDVVNAPDISRQITRMPGTDFKWDDAKKGTEIIERRVER